MWTQLTVEQRSLVRRLRGRGMKVLDVAREVGCSENVIYSTMNGSRRRSGRPDTGTPRASALTIHEREEILVGLVRGESLRSIARGLERSCSTVSREVRANGGREEYRIWPAHVRARGCAR